MPWVAVISDYARLNSENKEIAAVSSGPWCIPLCLKDVAKLPHIPPPNPRSSSLL